MSSMELTAAIESGKNAVFAIYVVLVFLTVLVIRRQNKVFARIPVKTTLAHLVKRTDFIGDSSAEYFEQRRASTVGKYQYAINGKTYTMQIQTAYGGSLQEELVLYYKKGHGDVRTTPNVTPSSGSNLYLVFHFALVCPILAGGIWLLIHTVCGRLFC